MIYNKDGLTINTSDSWNGKQGQEVQLIISGALDSTVTDVIIETTDIDVTKGVPYWILKGGEAKDQENPSGYISLITPSEYEIHLTIGTAQAGNITEYTIPSFVSEDFTQLNIPYVYWFTEQGSVVNIGNVISTIHVYINGTEKLSKQISSYSNGFSVGTITLTKELFSSSENNIRIIVTSNYGGGQTQLVAVEKTINLISLNLDCDINVGDNTYDIPIIPTQDTDQERGTLRFHFNLNLSDNGVLPSYLQGNIALKIYLYGLLATTLSNLNDFSTTIETLKGSTPYQPGNQDIYVQLVATNEQNLEVKSNLIWYRFLGKDDTENNSLSGLYLGFKLNIDSIPAPDYIKSVLQFTKNQFSFVIFNLDDTINSYSYGFGQSLQTYEIEAKQQEQYCSKEYLNFYKTFDTNEPQLLDIRFGNSSLLSLTINVIESHSIFAFPTTNLILNLNGSGKLDGKKDTSWTYNDYSCELYNFNWIGNGWNNSKLHLNQGATAIIPCEICSYSTFSIIFNIETKGINNEALISCLSTNQDLGFIIYSDKIVCKPYIGGNFSYTFGEGLHEIGIVKYGSGYKNTYIVYVDGSIQSIRQIESSDTHSNPITLTANKDELIVSNVIAYSRSLSFNEVQAIYGYHKDSGMEEYFNDNNIFGTNNISGIKYQGDKITPDTLPVGASYMIIEADSCDDKPWETINKYPGNTQAIADKYKGIRHKIKSIKYVRKSVSGSDSSNFFIYGGTLSAQGTSSMNYYLKNFRIYTKKTIDSTLQGLGYNSTPLYLDGGKKGDNGFSTYAFTGVSEDFYYDGSTTTGTYTAQLHQSDPNKAPSIKIQLYKQGEGFGSEVYEHGSAPANIFCLKADYAESSGCHNTGFARFANFFLKNSADVRGDSVTTNDVFGKDGAVKDVPQEIHRGNYEYDIRTTIDGKPVYLFFKDASGNIYYHGKYNLNNEKASAEVFGFTGVADYYNNNIVKSEGAILASLFGSIQNGQDYFKHTHQTYDISNGSYKDKEDGSGTYINPNECWEFSNNEFTTNEGLTKSLNNIGAFQYPYPVNSSYPLYNQYSQLNPFTALGDTVNSEGVTETKLAWINQAWEYRFPKLEDNKYDGTHTTDDLYQNGQKPYLLDSLYKWIYKHNITLVTNKEAVANRFAYQLSWYFNVNYLVKYYVLTKFFACVDQRVKNSMLAFLCEPDAVNNDGTIDSESPMGHMRAFFIFYDNDTILGLSNDGTLKWPWNVDEGSNNTDYSGAVSAAYAGTGACGVWETLEYCLNIYLNVESKILVKSDSNKYAYELGKYIVTAYGLLSNMLPRILNELSQFDNYFESICNHFNDSAYNLDAQVKYIFPEKVRAGQVGTINDNLEKETGNRKPHRVSWMKNRKAWYDDMYGQGEYNQYLYAFKVSGVGTSTKSSEITVKQAFPKFKFYAATGVIQVSSALSTALNLMSTISVPSTSVSDSVTISGLYAAEILDFSNFMLTSSSYLSQVDAMTASEQSLNYLKRLIYTPDNSRTGDEAYQYINDSTLSAIINSNRLPNLEILDFANIRPSSGNSFNILDLSGFNSLTSVDTSNTVINRVKLPKGSSLQSLVLDSPIYVGKASDNNPDNNDEGITNKSNLTSISIGFSRLQEIVIGDNNNQAVYDYIFNNLYTLLQGSNDLQHVTIRFSNDRLNPTSIGNQNNAIDNLIEIAKLVIDDNLTGKFNVSGFLYSDALLDNDDAGYLTLAFGKNLIITSSIGKVTLRASGNRTLVKEGEEAITLSANGYFSKDSNWSITVGGIDYKAPTKHDLLKYLSITFNDNEEPSSVSITPLVASEVLVENANVGFNRVPVIVTVKDDDYDSATGEDKANHIATVTFYVTYTPLSSIRINSKNGKDIIVGDNEQINCYTDSNAPGIKGSDIVITTNSGCTKVISNNNIKLYTRSSSSDPFTESPNNYIQGMNMDGDIEVKVSILGISSSNTLMLYEDVLLLQVSDLDSLSQYYWIKELRISQDPYSTGTTITKKYLNDKFDINSLTIAGFSTTNSNQEQIYPDLEYLKYCNWISGSFNIPSYQFSGKLCIPDKVTSVTWTMNSFAQDLSYSGLVIEFPKNMETCQLNLSGLLNLIQQLTLDFSKCEKITTLCGLTRPANVSNNYISIKFTYNNPNESNNSYTLTTNSLLLLPSTINLIGYYDLTSNSYPDNNCTMFNISGKSISDTNTVAAFIIPAVSGEVTLGAIYGYRTTLAESASTLPIQQLNGANSLNIMNMSHTCAYLTCTMTDMNINLTSLLNLGPFSFFSTDNTRLGTITFGNSLLTIGNSAFGKANVQLLGDSAPDVKNGKTFQVFPSLNKIGQSAFLQYQPLDSNSQALSTYIEVTNRLFVAEAYSLASSNGYPLNLYLNYTKQNENDPNPTYSIDSLAFGNKGNNIDSYLYVGNEYCYNELTSQQNYSTIRDRLLDVIQTYSE